MASPQSLSLAFNVETLLQVFELRDKERKRKMERGRDGEMKEGRVKETHVGRTC